MDRDQTETAARDLERLRQERDLFNTAMPTAEGDPEAETAADIWGRRVGRALGVVLLIALLLWLAATYL